MIKQKEKTDFFYWHAFLLCSLIFSQPLFSDLGTQPEFLLAHQLTGLNLLVWIAVVAFLPALLVLSVIYALTKILKKLENPIRRVALFILFALFFFCYLNRSTGLNPSISLAAACLSAAVFVVIYGKSVYFRTFLTVAAFMAVAAPAVFALQPSIRQILIPQSTADGASTDGQGGKHPVVVVVLDELSTPALLDTEGNINAERFPNFAALAGQSTWYRYASTVAEATLMAVPPILTGRVTDATSKKLPLAAHYPENLFTLLSGTHRVNAFETFTQLCPEQLCNAMKPDWKVTAEDTAVVFAHIATPDQYKRFLPQIDNKWVGYLRDRVETENVHTDQDLHPHHRYKVRLDKFRLFMDALETIDRSSLNYLHILMPHSPWMYLPDGRVYSHMEQRPFTGTLPDGTAGLEYNKQLYSQQHLMDHTRQRHLLQTGYTDRLLGEIISVLRERRMFDDALVVVVADHGVSFRPGQSLREATDTNIEDILSVPLFIKYPGQTIPETSDRAARTVDILPTILDSLGIRAGNLVFDGRSLLQPAAAEPQILELQHDTGEVRKITFPRFRKLLDRTVRERQGEFANGPIDDLFRINGEKLVNEPAQSLSIGPAADFTMKLDSPHLYLDIDLSRAEVPALIRANRAGEKRTAVEIPVAVSVNGVIRAVSMIQRIDTVPFEFLALVSPNSFTNGPNKIGFYQVNQEADHTWLAPILSERNRQATLTAGEDAELILNLESGSLPVDRSGGFGEATVIADRQNRQIRVIGWAALSDNGQIASDILFFSANEMIGSTSPHLSAPTAMENTGFANAEYSGFNFVIPWREKDGPGLKELSAVAVFRLNRDEVAGELSYVNHAKRLVRTRPRLGGQLLRIGHSKAAGDTITLGTVYDFSDDDQAMLFAGPGWSRQSSSGARWNTTDKASLKFTVENGQFPLEVIVQSSPFFVAGKHESQAIEASFASGNRQLIQLQKGENDGKFVLHVAQEDIGPDGNVKIDLKFPNAVSPKSLSVNEDPRLLAVKVKSLQVLAVAPR